MPIELKNITHTYLAQSELSRTALKELTLTIREGEFVGLIGHTGSGKSTLVQIIGGLLQPSSGKVLVDGLDMSDKKQRKSARSHVGIVFQYPEYQLFEETVREDIAYGPRNMGLSAEEVDARVREAMAQVGLAYERFAEKSPFELSGGEKRRAALAGTLAMRPKYLILDEPMAGLDPQGRQDILRTICDLRENTGCAVVMVSHSMDDMAQIAKRILVLSGGALVRDDAPAAVFGQPEFLESIRLDLPEISKLALLLRARGVETPPVYLLDDMADFLLERGKAHV